MGTFDRRTFLRASVGAMAAAMPRLRAETGQPNIVLILADDLGYGDVGCYGSKIRTPNIDALAADGVQLRQFYSASPVCSPSRAAILTGRYPARMGLSNVLFPNDDRGIPDSETTSAQMLKQAGYRTVCIGKWHLGAKPKYLPTNRGFDEYFGLPYSNDMNPATLLYNQSVVDQQVDLSTLTQRYTEKAVESISTSPDAPFFMYLAPNAPHIPLAPGARFRRRSGHGAYGDSVQELDWCVGEVLRAIRERGIENNTLVMFTSDNGPWYLGSTNELSGRKGETYEGGVRVPFVARFPGRIPAGRYTGGVASALDLLPTMASLSGAPLPGNPLDGVDMWPLLAGWREDLERDLLLYFAVGNLQCARVANWKLHVARFNEGPWNTPPPEGLLSLPLPQAELYDLESDPEEGYDEAGDNPELVAAIRAKMDTAMATFPDNIRALWRDMLKTPVEDTPAGARPILRKPGA